MLELALYRKAHPGQTVHGLVIFLDAGCDEPDSPWVGSLGTGPLLRPVYLDAVLAAAREREPDQRLRQADPTQLEAWAEAIFDAASLEELLGRK